MTMLEAKIENKIRHGKGGVFNLELKADCYYPFGCRDCKDFVEVQSKTNEMRREVHNLIDHYIDRAVEDFLKNEFKTLD